MPGRERVGSSVISKLRELNDKYPDLRVCQLIGNAYPEKERKRRGDDMYYVTDELLLKWLDEFDKKVTQMALERAGRRPDGR